MATSAVQEVIREGETYTLDEFKKRTRMARNAYLAARRNGLKTVKIHSRTYIRGVDWIDYLTRQLGN